MTREQLRDKQLILKPRIQELYISIDKDHFEECVKDKHDTCKIKTKYITELLLLEKEYHTIILLIIENDRGELERGEIVFSPEALDLMNKLEKDTKSQLEFINKMGREAGCIDATTL